MPSLSPEQLNQISGLVAEYIEAQRKRFRDRAVPLSAAQRSVFAPFFRADLLETTRVLVLAKERIGNPTFYPLLQGLGFANLPDFALMAAVTFNDVIVSHESFSDGLLFHECVHAEQYRQLGVPRFAALYVQGFLTGGGYEGIPLEINAYVLGERFESSPQIPFSVEAEVSAWIQQGKF
ncbi:MAG TPA: hypothetical protein VMH48_03545 [Methylomirabilota bacterium]|nr:hypothetical protein [Methylomirabilota bacterium]